MGFDIPNHVPIAAIFALMGWIYASVIRPARTERENLIRWRAKMEVKYENIKEKLNDRRESDRNLWKAIESLRKEIHAMREEMRQNHPH